MVNLIQNDNLTQNWPLILFPYGFDSIEYHFAIDVFHADHKTILPQRDIIYTKQRTNMMLTVWNCSLKMAFA